MRSVYSITVSMTIREDRMLLMAEGAILEKISDFFRKITEVSEKFWNFLHPAGLC